MNYKPFLSLIEEFNVITIFRHANPDGDAVGSQLALKEFINSNFKDKKVYAVGKDVFDKYPFIDKVSDEEIESSLAIILDTANRERIDDERYKLAKKSVKIDHHPIVDQFADINYVDESSAATCELLTSIITSDEFKTYEINQKTAEYLYSGLLTDTLSFKTSNTTAHTLEIASILASKGISLYNINKYLTDKKFDIFKYTTYLRSKVEYKDGLATVIVNQDELKKYNLTDRQARNFVSELNGIIEFKIWALFTENKDGKYDGSIRSDKEFIINEVASKYNGGGHKNASGVKNLTKEDIIKIKEDLLNVINKIS